MHLPPTIFSSLLQLVSLNKVHCDKGHFCKTSIPSKLAQFCFEEINTDNPQESFSGMMELTSYENIQHNGYLNANHFDDVLKKNIEYSITDEAVIKLRAATYKAEQFGAKQYDASFLQQARDHPAISSIGREYHMKVQNKLSVARNIPDTGLQGLDSAVGAHYIREKSIEQPQPKRNGTNVSNQVHKANPDNRNFGLSGSSCHQNLLRAENEASSIDGLPHAMNEQCNVTKGDPDARAEMSFHENGHLVIGNPSPNTQNESNSMDASDRNVSLQHANNEVAMYYGHGAIAQAQPTVFHPTFHPNPNHFNQYNCLQYQYFNQMMPPKPLVNSSENNNFTPDKFAGTNMSDKSLRNIMKDTISNQSDVTDLGLELGFSNPDIDQYLNSNNPPTAAYKIALEWRNSRVMGDAGQICKLLHDAFVQIGKLRQTAVLCSDNECKHHQLINAP